MTPATALSIANLALQALLLTVALLAWRAPVKRRRSERSEPEPATVLIVVSVTFVHGSPLEAVIRSRLWLKTCLLLLLALKGALLSRSHAPQTAARS
ncbi:MAG: hypothetical protein ACYC0H_01380 [Solirubrobacteraceae bacterium]